MGGGGGGSPFDIFEAMFGGNPFGPGGGRGSGRQRQRKGEGRGSARLEGVAGGSVQRRDQEAEPGEERAVPQVRRQG